MNDRICKECGQPVEGMRAYCDTHIRERQRYQKQIANRKRRKARMERKCVVCKQSFIGLTTRKYCIKHR